MKPPMPFAGHGVGKLLKSFILGVTLACNLNLAIHLSKIVPPAVGTDRGLAKCQAPYFIRAAVGVK